MHDKLCNLLEACETPEAPLCPLQEISLKNGIWYGDEPVCQNQMFQNLAWIRKQRLITDLGLTADDGFFTVRMLNSLRVIPRNLKGANPEDANAEIKWLLKRKTNPTGEHSGKKIKSTAYDTPLHARLL